MYFKSEPAYASQYEEVLTFKNWAEKFFPDIPSNDTGIDLVAVTFTGEHHAIQCKNYSADHRIQKSDIDSFFTASGKSYFSQRIIVATTDHWTDNAEKSLSDQNPPVNVIGRSDLANSVIDWAKYLEHNKIEFKPKKSLRSHQQTALKQVIAGLQTADRGKLIMACGTGKTFTSLKIAETLAGNGKTVLFLVPSLALLQQTLTEWTQEAELPLHNFAVCSDSDVGKQKGKANDDLVVMTTHELNFPATTNGKNLAKAFLKHQTRDPNAMTVIYSTYHSIDAIKEAQLHGLPEIDLVICDEAHRTTGATYEGYDDSAFVRVHHNNYIKAKKRLYMTATPRIYTAEAEETDGVKDLYSMNKPAIYGEDLHVISFSTAVKQQLLVDYKVIVLAVEEAHINRRLEALLSREDNEIKVDDAAKIVGCWKALSKYGIQKNADDSPMKRAVAFCQVIEKDYKGNKHKVSSKAIAEMFDIVVSAYQEEEKADLFANDPNAILDQSLSLKCEAEHVDGSMNAGEKSSRIEWLKAETDANTCRILSNVRCLSEGVDVPALDAVLFLTPRNSQVDVVQSVGRVMRKAEGKTQGYIILPVVIPTGVDPSEALDNNQNYRVVWEVLQALRSHDDRFDAMINKMEFDGAAKDKIEVIHYVDSLFKKPSKKQQANAKKHSKSGRGQNSIGEKDTSFAPEQLDLEYHVGEIERALVAKIVKKCGNRLHWQEWADDVAKIANTHIDRIQAILENPANTLEKATFNALVAELRDDLNSAISEQEVIEMLAQHLITKPVFDALFANDNFTQHNPMSQALQSAVEILDKKGLSAETKQLADFYDSIQNRISNINSPEGKQKIIKELYDNFFNQAFPKMAERLGIVYTPVEVVDFIIHSVEAVLNQEFNASLADNGVQILDPFTGTGTFITRLLQSGIIPPEKLPEKYNEIHANEIVLLAYYIAAINIESVYYALLEKFAHSSKNLLTIPDGDCSGLSPRSQANVQNSSRNFVTAYQPFNGICLTDTFQMAEKGDLVDDILVENSKRRKTQMDLDIRVIIGNPPYSAGQESANDNNANVAYPKLDEKIRSTYAEYSTATNKNGLYDSYIRAIRWASDRIIDNGVIGFVTNGGYLESNSADGLRKCLAEEFSSLYIFHLRGNARTSGERRRKEKDNIFGQGTRTPIAIAILVKNKSAVKNGQIFFHDIGDYLSQREKLDIIADFKDIHGISKANGWTQIIPDQFNDWLNQRDVNFDNYILLGTKDKGNKEHVVFSNYSAGLQSNRDAWVYNFSHSEIINNMQHMVAFYNDELERFNSSDKQLSATDFCSEDPTKISWSSSLLAKFSNGIKAKFDKNAIRTALYRPYTKSLLYFDSMFNHRPYQIPKLFPTANVENEVIYLSGIGNSGKPFSALIVDVIPDLNMQHSGGQGFPLYLYEPISANEQESDLFCTSGEKNDRIFDGYQQKEAISDEALNHFQAAYQGENISKEMIFYYIYGLLHSEEYREKYADNLSKQLPRIPCVKRFSDFVAFEQAGRKLAELHLNYESVPMYDGVELSGGLRIENDKIIGGADSDFYVEKMKFAKKDDKTKLIYNHKFRIEHIPEMAYEYVVNGKPALEWVIERQSVKTDKASGIVNNANDWAIETMNNARYPMELFLRVVNVSLKTVEIVKGLPKLEV
ncbi:type ISP restriction/modification enzyme [Lonepinella koalarum]|uniref:DEAD/DEAH box helicase n=1 Tax=Lonepinella koalarum TaxID=53417 RepID=UPI001FB4A07E|nr:type ISP restriction/modification enzyme [Lonepinella koalarum]